MTGNLSPYLAAMLVIGTLLILGWYAWLAPRLWRNDRGGLLVCSAVLLPYVAFLVMLLSSGWFADPVVSASINAASAVIQALLAAGLFAFTAYSVALSRKTFATYRQERLDSTLPVLLFQIFPHEDDLDASTTTILVRALNGGVGPALDIHSSWEQTSSFTLTPTSPIALAAGESLMLTLTGSVFTGMFHSFPGMKPSPEIIGPEPDKVYTQLGILQADYTDLHQRRLSTEAKVVIRHLNRVEPVPEADGSIRTSIEAEHSAFELFDFRMSLPVQPPN